jgi:hypothetical protein
VNLKSDRQISGQYVGIHGQSPLLRSSDGHILIPASILFAGLGRGVDFSDQDLDVIYAELICCRTVWRIRFYGKLVGILTFLTWTFWLLPCAAAHHWPFA